MASLSSKQQIKIGAIISYIVIFIYIISGLVYTPWMMNKIGKSDYGLYTLAMSLINTFLIDFGLSLAIQRYVSKFLAEGNQQAADNVAGLINRLYFYISLFIALVFFVLFFFVDFIYVKLTPVEIERFKGLYIIAAIYSTISFPFIPINGILSSYEKFIQLKLSELILRMVSISLTVTALLMGFGVYSLVVVNAIAGIIYILVRIFCIKKYTPIKPNIKYKDNKLLKDIFAFSIWASVYTLIFRFIVSLGPSILGIVSGSEEIAVFGYAVSLEHNVYTFINAINGFFMPQVSRISTLEAGQDREQVIKLMTKVGRIIFMLFALMFIGFLIMGPDFIKLLFGEEYKDSYLCTILLIAYGIIAYPQRIGNTYILVKNKVKTRSIFAIISFVAYIPLAFIFGIYWGAIGVSAAIFIALLTDTIMLNWYFYKSLKLDIFKFFKDCQLKLMLGMLITLAVAIGIKFIPVYGWLGFCFKVALICVSYFVIAWFLMLNKDEKNLIFKRKKKEAKNDN